MLEIVRELINIVASMRGITANRQAELHARLDEVAGIVADTPAEPEQAAPVTDGSAAV